MFLHAFIPMATNAGSGARENLVRCFLRAQQVRRVGGRETKCWGEDAECLVAQKVFEQWIEQWIFSREKNVSSIR